MARTAGRSRGCGICRKRRVKCDETLPECTQCKKNGKKCPGPITDTFYVIATDARTFPSSSPPASSQLSRNSTIHPPSYSTSTLDSSNEALQPVVQKATTDRLVLSDFNTSALTKVRNDVFLPTIPSYYQPSRAEAFEQLFFSHFFSAYGHGIEMIGACSWLAKLPSLIATSHSSPTMRYAVRATSMAFYGRLNASVSIQTEARRTYTKALETRRKDICRNTDANRTPEEALCSTVLMCYFELVVKTTPLAWMQHLDAAVAILEAVGPEACQKGLMHQLFRTVRLGIGFSSVMLKKPHIFARDDWKTIPFPNPKMKLDDLVDVVLLIPEYISRADSMIYTASTFDLEESLQNLWAGLSVLILDLDTQIQNDAEPLPLLETDVLLPNHDSIMPVISYSGPFAGCLAAIRHAAYLICFSLLSTESIGNQDQAFHHSEAVLHAVGHVDTCSESPASSLFLTTVFALNVVSVWSPSPLHQEHATKKLEGKFN
ncbi:hypothetical protein LOCC1_G007129 [Lachnellula occidentalis]|uniref:Zn(2)-C6 fungal-type domain-containing protein n=1 Tax=Lachnellula occidentalis TaxID=215460 RepID=A0A8H8RIJ8_9HELO|nr:hypothetical protein LOCC1_G007129 [Lachnellula occidentalis]